MILRRLRLALALAAAAFACAACGAPPAESQKSVAPVAPLAARGPVLRFSFEAIDGRKISTESLAGRVSVIGFYTTYDFASQVQARTLASVARHHVPRINVAGLVLEPPENRMLIEAFASTLNLGYPIALADTLTITGNGPFAGLHHVPSVVILDREGREVWRKIGLIDEAALEAVLRGLDGPEPQAPR